MLTQTVEGEIVLGVTEQNVLPFTTYLRGQGIFLVGVKEEEMELLKETFGYAYKAYCSRNSFQIEAEFEKI